MTAPAAERNPLTELPPMPDTAEPIVLRGLLPALGLNGRPKSDFQKSIEAGLMESFEDFCERLSREAP